MVLEFLRLLGVQFSRDAPHHRNCLALLHVIGYDGSLDLRLDLRLVKLLGVKLRNLRTARLVLRGENIEGKRLVGDGIGGG